MGNSFVDSRRPGRLSLGAFATGALFAYFHPTDLNWERVPMLDIRLFREEPARLREGLKAKNADPSVVDQVLDLDKERRACFAESDELKRVRKEQSKEIGARMKAGEDMSAVQAEMRSLGDRIRGIDDRLREIEVKVLDFLLRTPNLPHSSVPRGGGNPRAPPGLRVRRAGLPAARPSRRSPARSSQPTLPARGSRPAA